MELEGFLEESQKPIEVAGRGFKGVSRRLRGFNGVSVAFQSRTGVVKKDHGNFKGVSRCSKGKSVVFRSIFSSFQGVSGAIQQLRTSGGLRRLQKASRTPQNALETPSGREGHAAPQW